MLEMENREEEEFDLGQCFYKSEKICLVPMKRHLFKLLSEKITIQKEDE